MFEDKPPFKVKKEYYKCFNVRLTYSSQCMGYKIIKKHFKHYDKCIECQKGFKYNNFKLNKEV